MKKRGMWLASVCLGGLLASGCGDSEFDLAAFQNSPPPLAVDDSFQVLGGGQLSASVTANDTVNGAVVLQFQNPGTAGGTVQVGANGQLTYTPPAGQSNLVDTFTYQLANAAGSSTATVTVNVLAPGFFVDNTAPPGGNGNQLSPFNTLAAALAAANGINGAEIVVFRGDGTNAGLNTAVALGPNQVLRSFDSNAPSLSGPITLAGNTTLSGLRIEGTGGISATGVSGIVVQNCTLANTPGDGARFVNLTGNLQLLNNQFINNGDEGLEVETNAGLLSVALGNNTVSNSTGHSFLVNVTGTGNITWSEDRTTVNNSGNGVLAGGNSWLFFTRNDGSAFNATMTNCLSDGSNRIGLEAQAFALSNITLVFDQGIIRNGVDRGINLVADGSSMFRGRVSNTDTSQNFPNFGFEASRDAFGTMCLRMFGVTCDVYRLINNTPGAPPPAGFFIENFVNFASENVGSITQLNTITNVGIGDCGIP